MPTLGNSPSHKRVLKIICVVARSALVTRPGPTPALESMMDENSDDVVTIGTVAQRYLLALTNRMTATLLSHGYEGAVVTSRMVASICCHLKIFRTGRDF
ncbi:hypothetical protein CEP88_00180 (plasmid) [Roseobacter denitrificans]|nr:hypothetical protein CEP88_00180 [Roseobacter denitrificans]SFG40711.1 hypothetical protein SAMN05443635_11628 [Roseobacter denitrificans OCh 114]